MAILQTSAKEDGTPNAIECTGHLGTSSAVPKQKKACHQCRQVTDKLGAPCGSVRSGKACSIRYCNRCLLNRYGEKTKNEVPMDCWSCPKCRGVCNCSVCMKKRGHAPTGPLAPTAKATGFVSVIDMLRRKAASTEKARIEKNDTERKKEESNTTVDGTSLVVRTDSARTTLESSTGSPVSTVPARNSNQNNDPSRDAQIDSDQTNDPSCRGFDKVVGIQTLGKKRKLPHDGESNAGEDACRDVKNVEVDNGIRCQMQTGLAFPRIKNPRKKRITTDYSGGLSSPGDAVGLPPGTCMTTVAGIELEAEDVGSALQFLEFCAAFGEVLGLKKGQPESILRGLFRGRAVRWTSNPLVAQLHSKLLSLTHQRKTGHASRTSWLQDIQKFVISFFNKSVRYDELDSSRRLRLLNFLCDEALGSKSLRCCIDEEITKYEEKKKEAKESLRIAKEKVQEMTQDPIKENKQGGDPLTVTKTVAKLDPPPEKKERSDAVRTSYVAIDGSGRAFWKLKGHFNGLRIVFQDIKDWNVVADQDKWFRYDDEEEKVIEKHVSSQRNWRLIRHRVMMRRALQDITNDAEQCSELV